MKSANNLQYFIQKIVNKMVFILIKRNNNYIEWWKINPSDKKYLDNYRDPDSPEIKLYNWGGGWNTLGSESDTILEVLEAKNWEVLEKLEHREKTTYYQNLKKNSTDKSLKIGWLSPEGEMHYCDYQEHISYVHEILDSDVPTIEKLGWLHIRKMDDNTPFFTSDKRITIKQAITLKEELGISVSDEEILYQ